jgi:hypothetical protein
MMSATLGVAEMVQPGTAFASSDSQRVEGSLFGEEFREEIGCSRRHSNRIAGGVKMGQKISAHGELKNALAEMTYQLSATVMPNSQ